MHCSLRFSDESLPRAAPSDSRTKRSPPSSHDVRPFPRQCFLFRGVGHEVRILVVRHPIHIHLLDPDVDRSMAEFEECRLEWSWILNGTSGGGGRNSESVQASYNVS